MRRLGWALAALCIAGELAWLGAFWLYTCKVVWPRPHDPPAIATVYDLPPMERRLCVVDGERAWWEYADGVRVPAP